MLCRYKWTTNTDRPIMYQTEDIRLSVYQYCYCVVVWCQQWYSSSQNHFSFSFYKVWAQSFQYKFLHSIWIIFSSSFYKAFLEIISVQFQYLHHFSNSFVIDNIRTQRVGFGKGLSENILIFLPRNGAFCMHSDTWLDSSRNFRQRQTNNFSISF